MRASELHKTSRLSFTVLVLAVALATPAHDASAVCGCDGSGIPVIKEVKMRGNDLRELRGSCATPNGNVQLRAYQQHLARERICPPDCPSDSPYSYCINQCRWTTIATTRADSAGRFTFRNIDSTYALQLIAATPGKPDGLDGVFTALRLRSQNPVTGVWSQEAYEPYLEAFNVAWPGYEGGFAYIEARVSGAKQVFVTIADGPDDGDQPSVALDVDQDTPNFWLDRHPYGTVQYTRYGICDPWQGCPATWHIAQSPSISVQSPPLGRGGEYPYVLGMVTASKPGGMLIGTSIMGPRDIPDVSIQADVDVDIDFDLGFGFFSIF